MLVIGEKINGMFKAVRKAVEAKDEAVIQQLAKAQLEAGADVLDVNVGTAQVDPVEGMGWLVETIRKVTPAPLAIDTTKANVMEEGLRLAGAGSFINIPLI